jgi:hypothetical protein
MTLSYAAIEIPRSRGQRGGAATPPRSRAGKRFRA